MGIVGGRGVPSHTVTLIKLWNRKTTVRFKVMN